jgi:hypothetical protein
VHRKREVSRFGSYFGLSFELQTGQRAEKKDQKNIYYKAEKGQFGTLFL